MTTLLAAFVVGMAVAVVAIVRVARGPRERVDAQPYESERGIW